MAALTAAKRYTMKQRNKEEINSYAVRTGQTIYYGSLVGISTVGVTDGRVVKWTSGSGALRFLGIAIPRGTRDQADSVTGVAAGTVKCEVNEGGVTLEGVSVTGLTSEQTVNDPVYASDDQTFTLTATSNVGAVGRVTKYISSGVGNIQLYSSMEYMAMENVGKV
jgi:hypothetical protein